MPVSADFHARLTPRLGEIAAHFGTPFHLYDEAGIRQTGRALAGAFTRCGVAYREFFAVKALPNPHVLDIMQGLGFGFDCSSPAELALCARVGAASDDLLFTSTNTTRAEFAAALDAGALLNLDDVAMLGKLPAVPERLCFRYNPGERRPEGAFAFIGNPTESKFGIAHDQVLDAYRQARALGVKQFGIHSMHIANALDHRLLVETARLLLDLVERVGEELGIAFEFINLGGGLGIPYRPEDAPLDLDALAEGVAALLAGFEARHGYAPAVFTESGRYVTGPHGVLVTRVTNVKHTYRTFVGVDASMTALMRPGMYGAYHHVTAPGVGGDLGPADVVGSLCENTDKLAVQVPLPPLAEGDLLLVHDTGAHGHAMGFNYNGRLRPQELLLCDDGSVERIRRAETLDDYFATLDFAPDVLPG